MDIVSLGIVGGFALLSFIGVGILARGAPPKEATQQNYPSMYGSQNGGKKKTKRKKY